jgi:alpha-amylase
MAINTKNGLMLQAFSWYLPSDGQHWRRLAQMAPRLREEGFTSVWMPPAYKGQAGTEDVGYGVYDLWDLGEFDQKGTVRTKYGLRREYLSAIKAIQAEGIDVLADIVLNHRMGADGAQKVMAQQVSQDDRNQPVGEPRQIEAYTRFDFPGRAGRLDDFKWDSTCFTGVDYDEATQEAGVFRLLGKDWAGDVSHEMGNFDYLMGADVDLGDERVRHQLDKWGKWYLSLTGVDGVRLDAVKHMSRSFYLDWLGSMRRATGRELFCVGEYWSADLGELLAYLGDERAMSLFDVPLHSNFYRASTAGDDIDLAHILDGSLVGADPVHAVTFVDNHDTQPDQALESTVQPWFKPLAYALILLREEGYPCVFMSDLFGLPNDGIPAVPELELLMEVRRRFAYGAQRDWFDERDLVGWTREGTARHGSSGAAVLLSTRRGDAAKRMCVGEGHAGETWRCVLGCDGTVTIGDDGCADFPTGGALLTLYLPQAAADKLDNIPILVRPQGSEG